MTWPGLGDKLDRLTILARKVVEGREDLRPEFDGLVKSMGYDMTVMLAALNAAIWDRENVLRALAKADEGHLTTDIARCALQIQQLNDKRAALIAELNGTPSEKLYKQEKPPTPPDDDIPF